MRMEGMLDQVMQIIMRIVKERKNSKPQHFNKEIIIVIFGGIC